jgi:NADPH-dependent glutamate synthase beta subunit-like oxidoreductase
MMRYGIPAYRLPREVLAREISEIVGAGVKIETSTRVESPSRLLKEGFDAVLVAIGTWRGSRLEIPGEDSDKVVDGLAFLNRINTGGDAKLGKNVIVVGGGNTAIDAARTAIRVGARQVTILYRRTRNEMPASHEEIEGALSEGVQAEFLASPLKIEEKDGALELTCQRMQLGKKDSSGRPRVSAIPDSEFTISCDTILVAVGQTPEMGEMFGLETVAGGVVQRDKESFATSQPAIFAAGDVAEGPTSIIEAVAQGRRAASAMDRYLGGDGSIDETPAPSTAADRLEPAARGTARPHVDKVSLKDRFGSFKTVELGFTISAAGREARRCLGCDLQRFEVTVDPAGCKECGYCEEVCKLGVYSWANFTNDRVYRPMQATRPDRCIGCKECVFACPDFAITVAERGCGQ